jgi:hypothetical protein
MSSTDLPSSNLTNTSSNDEVYEYVNESGDIVEYDLNRLVFCETVAEKIPSAVETAKPMVNYRINIQDRRADGKLQDLLVRTEDLFCFGVSESFDQKTGELNGYSLPLPMWNQEGATASQLYFTDFLEKTFLEKVKDHLLTVKKTFKRADLEIGDLKKMKIFYRKKDDDGAVNPNDPPTWYPKLIASKKKNMKIVTRFYQMDESGNSCIDESGDPIELDPIRLKEKWGRAKAVVKIEGIYIRSEGASVQCKVWEADYRPTESALPRKGKINRATATVVRSDDTNPMAILLMANRSQEVEQNVVEDSTTTTASSGSDEHDAGGDISVTDEPMVGVAPVVKKTIVRKVVVAKKPSQ